MSEKAMYWKLHRTLRERCFSLNKGKYGPEKSPYLDTFHTVGETGRRLIESAKDEGGQDAKLHLFKHAIQTRHIWYH